VAEEATHPARRWLDSSACGGRLGVIAIFGHADMMSRECAEHLRCPNYE
jgi:hypothetical protein